MNNHLLNLKIELETINENIEPRADLYHCYLCECDFNISDCDSYEDGDWENGYYTVHFCPSCGDDGGEYTMSNERAKEWCEWNVKKNVK